MTEEKKRYVTLMIGDLFEAYFGRPLSPADMDRSLQGFDPASATAFCGEVKTAFKSDCHSNELVGAIVEAAYEACKDTLLTADAIVAQPPANDPYGMHSEENARYFRTLDEIERGLMGLADEVHAAVSGKRDAEATSLILERSREKLRLYDLFMPTLDEDDAEEADGVVKDDIDFLRESIPALEAAARS